MGNCDMRQRTIGIIGNDRLTTSRIIKLVGKAVSCSFWFDPVKSVERNVSTTLRQVFV